MESIKKKKCLQLFIKKSQSLNKNIIENITKYNKKKLKKIEWSLQLSNLIANIKKTS